MYPVPFAGPQQFLTLASRASALGYTSVWANDHYTTQAYVRKQFSQPPSYYEPLITLASVAATVPRVKLGTGVLALPMRDAVVLAKQVATLDVFSGGRVCLGVGLGAYREEYVAAHPRSAVHRGTLLTETLTVLRLLLESSPVSFDGQWVSVEGLEMFPRPVQQPLPIYVAGNSSEAVHRAALFGQAWMPGAFSEEWGQRRVAALQAAAFEAGRDPALIGIAPQFACSLARHHEVAAARYRASQLYRHLESLATSTLKGLPIEDMADWDLVGTPDAVAERLSLYRSIGVTECPAIIFVANAVGELEEQMELFATEVMQHFRSKGGESAWGRGNRGTQRSDS